MASNEAKVIITADDKTKAGIKSAEKGFGSLSASAKKLGGVLVAAFATKKILDFGASTVSAFAEAEAQMVIFNQTLKNMGARGESMRNTLIEASNSVTRFGFDNEEAAVALARFAKQTGDASEAVKLNQLVMDIARTKGIGYAEAADTVTKALNGQFRGLQDLGFVADESKTALENLNEVQKQVAGTAEGFLGTPMGALQAFQAQWGETKEAMGGALYEGLQPFMQELNKLIAQPEVLAFFTALGQIIGGTLKFAFWALTGAIKEIEFQINMLVVGWRQLFDFLEKYFKAAWSGITAQFNVAVEGITKLINKIRDLINAFKDLNIVQGAKNLGSKIASSLGFKADGGPVSSNNPYIVGERGPELFVPNASGSIIPNNRLAGAGSSITINISGNTLLDGSAGEKLANQIMRTLKQNLRI